MTKLSQILVLAILLVTGLLRAEPPKARPKSRAEEREELIAKLEAKYGGKALLAGELEIVQLDAIVKFFDFNDLQNRVAPSALPNEFFEDYLAHPDAMSSLPADVQRQLSEGLSRPTKLDAAALGIIVAGTETTEKPAPLILDASGKPVRGEPVVVTATPTTRVPQFTMHFLGGIAGISGGLVLPDSPLLSKDYPVLKQRWLEYLATMSDEQKNRFLRLDYLPARMKSKVVTEFSFGQVNLRQDLPDYERKLFQNWNWSPDLSSLEFRTTVPFTTVREYVETLYAFAELTGVTDLLENPTDKKIRSDSYHVHAMASTPSINQRVDALREKTQADHATWQERLEVASEAETYLNEAENGRRRGSLAEELRGSLIDAYAAIQLAKVERETGKIIDDVHRWESNAHLERRAHVEPPEQELEWLLKALTLPAGQANRWLAKEIQDGLTPEIMEHLAMHSPSHLLEMIQGSEGLVETPLHQIETFDWHLLDETDIFQLYEIMTSRGEGPIFDGIKDYLYSREPGRRGALALLSWNESSSGDPTKHVSAASLNYLLGKGSRGADRLKFITYTIDDELGERFSEKVGVVLSEFLSENRIGMDVLFAAGHFYRYLTEDGKRIFGETLATSSPLLVRQLLQTHHPDFAVYENPLVRKAVITYLATPGFRSETVQERLRSLLRFARKDAMTPAVVETLAEGIKAAGWHRDAFIGTYIEFKNIPALAAVFLESLRDQITANRTELRARAHHIGLSGLKEFIDALDKPGCRPADWNEYSKALAT